LQRAWNNLAYSFGAVLFSILNFACVGIIVNELLLLLSKSLRCQFDTLENTAFSKSISYDHHLMKYSPSRQR
jgi:hypothetical protein